MVDRSTQRRAILAAAILAVIALLAVAALLALLFTPNTLGFGRLANLSPKRDAQALAECQTLLLTIFGFWLVWAIRKYFTLNEARNAENFTITLTDVVLHYLLMALFLIGLGLVVWVAARTGVTFGSGDLGTGQAGVDELGLGNVSETIKEGEATILQSPLTILTKAVYAATGAAPAYRIQTYIYEVAN